MKLSDEQIRSYARAVRARKPLVHCITNTVTIWDCANILLAAGASPTMAHHKDEVAEITAGCDALVCNLGAMDDFEAMLNAAEASEHPLVVDPVGCGGSAFRRARFAELAKTGRIRVIRGNASEIMALSHDMQTVTGVDGDPGLLLHQRSSVLDAAGELARRLSCIVIASGVVDLVTDGAEVIEVEAGDAMMSRITGCGCMSSVLLGAYLAAEPSLTSAAAACYAIGICGERAAARTRQEDGGTMTFHMHLIDEMSKFELT